MKTKNLPAIREVDRINSICEKYKRKNGKTSIIGDLINAEINSYYPVL